MRHNLQQLSHINFLFARAHQFADQRNCYSPSFELAASLLRLTRPKSSGRHQMIGRPAIPHIGSNLFRRRIISLAANNHDASIVSSANNIRRCQRYPLAKSELQPSPLPPISPQLKQTER